MAENLTETQIEPQTEPQNGPLIESLTRSLDGLTLAQTQHMITDLFAQNLINTPALDARLLLCAACQIDDVQLILQDNQTLPLTQARSLAKLVTARLSGQPVSRIINHREFYGLPFRLSKHTLDPRPDSETLVTAVLDKLLSQHPSQAQLTKTHKDKKLSVLDLGTGSGCLLLAVLSELPNAMGLGVDISAGALRMARLNASLNGLRARAFFRQSHWFSHVSGRFDIILSNPPYICAEDLAGLAPEVKDYDPIRALVANQNGFGDFIKITNKARLFLNQGGWLGFEVGKGQADAVAQMMSVSGFSHIEMLKDLAGIDRVVMAQKT